ncbi:MAG: FkbM family methyltransferase [Candidatus Bathyarchaeia archaeon]
MKVYFLGGKTLVSLRDSRGGKLHMEVSEDNVDRIILLSNILYELHDKYAVSDNEIKCEPCPNIIVTLRNDFTAKELHLLKMHHLLGKYVTSNVRFDDEHYLATDIDGFKWILRKASLIEDATFGLLLPYITEPEEYEWFVKALRKGGTFLDIGANVGGYTVRACKKGVKTIAIEPDPDNYRLLKLNLRLNHCTNSIVLNMAAGSKREIRQLHFGRDNSPAGYSVIPDKFAGTVKCSVEVKPVDIAIAPLLDDGWIDLVKIDVEGFEVEVIKGALNLLKRTRHIIVEVIPSTESKINEVMELLTAIGFKLVDKVCRHSLYCDLFLNRQI